MVLLECIDNKISVTPDIYNIHRYYNDNELQPLWKRLFYEPVTLYELYFSLYMLHII